MNNSVFLISTLLRLVSGLRKVSNKNILFAERKNKNKNKKYWKETIIAEQSLELIQ